MKILVSVLALTSLLVTSTASAISQYCGPNGLGVFFDTEYEQNWASPPVYVPFHVYFVLTWCQFETIGGFEFGWNFNPVPSPEPIIAGSVLPPYALNLGTNKNFLVGLGIPLVTGDVAVLADLTLVLLAPLPATYITVGPATPSSMPYHAVFNDGADVGHLVMMSFCNCNQINQSGWAVPGIASLNGPIPVEDTSWSNVKVLFE